MAFLESRLDTKITAGAGVAVRGGRAKTYLPNGRLQQDFQRAIALHEYDLSHGLRSAADFQTVLAAFYVVMFTPYEGFRLRDPKDYTATQTNSKLTLITGATYQLQRVHSFGGVEYLRDIKKPNSDVVVKRTRSGSVTTASATVDTTTGIATISGHVGGDTYTWEGTFDVPVTFVDDEWTGSLDVGGDNLHITSAAIKLEELLLI
jgi:uncharacterized protein (TIGR02217 family)